jgi:hypothetical protein
MLPARLSVLLAAAVIGTASAQTGHCRSFRECEAHGRGDVSEGEMQAVTAIMHRWDRAVTVDNDAQAVAALFCGDGSELWGTVSDNLRTSIPEIKSYFDYFAVKDNTIVAECSFVTRSAVGALTNARKVQWSLGGTITCARMEFQLSTRAGNETCIKSLHSSLFPDEPEQLQAIDRDNNVTWPLTASTGVPMREPTRAPTAAPTAVGTDVQPLLVATAVLATTNVLLFALLAFILLAAHGRKHKQPELERKSARTADPADYAV